MYVEKLNRSNRQNILYKNIIYYRFGFKYTTNANFNFCSLCTKYTAWDGTYQYRHANHRWRWMVVTLVNYVSGITKLPRIPVLRQYYNLPNFHGNTEITLLSMRHQNVADCFCIISRYRKSIFIIISMFITDLMWSFLLRKTKCNIHNFNR